MILCELYCPQCGWEDELFCRPQEGLLGCKQCGSLLKKRLGTPHMVVPDVHKAVNSTFVSPHDRWFEENQTQIRAKLDAGVLATGDPQDLKNL